MISVLSPSKTLDYAENAVSPEDSPQFRKQSQELVGILKKKSRKDLMNLMDISEKLADLNYERYQNFASRFTNTNSKAAVLAFKGDVYLGLEAESLDEGDLLFAQDHLRILSGLYGLLRPLDKMQPYRLEMGTTLKNPKGKNLYDFWGDAITKALNKDLSGHKEKILVNLASQEYFNAVNTKKLKAKIIDIDFREFRNGKLRFISFNAKKARGLMARYIIKNRIEKFEDLKGFDLDDYKLYAELSRDNTLTFVK